MGEEFEVTGATDKPVSNVLPKGRYPFAVKEIEGGRGREKGILYAKVKIFVEGLYLTIYIMREGSMGFMWRHFLYSIGIRDSRNNWKVDADNIVGKEGLVDLKIVYEADGTTPIENKVCGFSPIEQETAPIKGVEPEPLTDIKPNEKLTNNPDDI